MSRVLQTGTTLFAEPACSWFTMQATPDDRVDPARPELLQRHHRRGQREHRVGDGVRVARVAALAVTSTVNSSIAGVHRSRRHRDHPRRQRRLHVRRDHRRRPRRGRPRRHVLRPGVGALLPRLQQRDERRGRSSVGRPARPRPAPPCGRRARTRASRRCVDARGTRSPPRPAARRARRAPRSPTRAVGQLHQPAGPRDRASRRRARSSPDHAAARVVLVRRDSARPACSRCRSVTASTSSARTASRHRISQRSSRAHRHRP